MRFLLVLILLTWLGAGHAAAQDAVTASTPEDVAIAFFHTGGVHPDYDKWARGSKGYKIAAPARAPEVLDKEKQRLMRRYKTYDPEADMVRVHADVLVSLHARQDGDSESYSMTLAFDGGDATYFPFAFQDYDIAVVPQNLQKLLEQPLTKDQFALLSKTFDDHLDGRAGLDIELKPARAYIEQPYPLDGKDQWMFLVNPVALTLRSGSGVLLWSYGADWYVSPQAKAVQGLYRAHDGAAAP